MQCSTAAFRKGYHGRYEMRYEKDPGGRDGASSSRRSRPAHGHVRTAGMIVAVQPDPAAPFVPVADYNIIADPAEFAGALLKELAAADVSSSASSPTCDAPEKPVRRTSVNRARNALANAFAIVLELLTRGRHEIASIARTYFDRSSGLFREANGSWHPHLGLADP